MTRSYPDTRGGSRDVVLIGAALLASAGAGLLVWLLVAVPLAGYIGLGILGVALLVGTYLGARALLLFGEPGPWFRPASGAGLGLMVVGVAIGAIALAGRGPGYASAVIAVLAGAAINVIDTRRARTSP